MLGLGHVCCTWGCHTACSRQLPCRLEQVHTQAWQRGGRRQLTNFNLLWGHEGGVAPASTKSTPYCVCVGHPGCPVLGASHTVSHTSILIGRIGGGGDTGGAMPQPHGCQSRLGASAVAVVDPVYKPHTRGSSKHCLDTKQPLRNNAQSTK